MGSVPAEIPSKPSILESLPGKLPNVSIPENVDFELAAQRALQGLVRLKREAFVDDALWRDNLGVPKPQANIISTASCSY